MKYGRIPGLAKPVSRICQGGMMLGTGERIEATFALLDAAVEHGITTFDLAHVYGGGDCERALGQWVTARGNREDVVIIDKGCHPAGPQKRVSPADISADIADHLERLHTDYVDIWMFHRDDPEVPVGPLVERCNEHLRRGEIRAYGGSNWTVARIREANAYAEEHGLVGFAGSSPNFSLAEQVQSPWGPDCVTISGPRHAADRQWYAQTGTPLFTWSSIARGFFSGRLRRETFDPEAGQLEGHAIRSYVCDDNWERLERVYDLAQRRGLTVPQVALAWVLGQPLNIFALVGGATPAEVAANAATIDIELTADDIAWLDLRD